VDVFTLTNGCGNEVRLLEYGGIVQSIRTPDQNGITADVTLGCDSLDAYQRDQRFTGALIGRFANRIALGRFTLEGRTWELDCNNGPNHLHGGPGGFHTVVWRSESFVSGDEAGVVLSHTSPDGDAGYPGRLAVRVRCALGRDHALSFDIAATTDRATPVSITQHSYFNLSGRAGEQTITDHELTLHAAHYTPVDGSLIPTGERRPVRGTPFDFTAPQPVGSRIGDADEQIGFGHGYDHNFVLDQDVTDGVRPAATLYHPGSGRSLAVLTTAPGMQFYSGNMLDDGGNGTPRVRNRSALALEAQQFPDSPNQPGFPNTILRPGERYASRIVYRFAAGIRP